MRETAGKGSAASALVPVSPAPLVELVLDSLASPHSRRAYDRALGEFFAWYPSNASGEGFTRAVLGRYRSHLIERGLSAASINLSLAALRKLATEAAAHGGLSPLVAAGIRGVPGARRSGVWTGNWLTLPQASQLLAAPDPATTKGLRDRVTVYGHRRDPFGIRACLSSDQGETWDIENEIILRDDLESSNLGYPTSIVQEDGGLFTVYWGEDSNGVTTLQGTYWRV